MTWTAERTEKVVALWQKGLSATQIADILGGVTRNAVIGKVHRMGLSGRADRKDAGNLSRRRARPRRQALVPRPTEPKPVKRVRSALTGMPTGIPWEPAEIPSPTAFDAERLASGDTVTGVLMLDLRPGRPHDCRFQVGTSWNDPVFCGCDAVPGQQWCEHHLSRVFTSVRPADQRPFMSRGPLGKTIERERHAHANAAEFLEPA